MDPKKFLAETVLNERRNVTYRLLSRALKIHANRAKQILFDFHATENAKRPQSVHATYVITGIQNPPEPPATNGHAKDEDEIMQSSPYLPSSIPNQEGLFGSVEYTAITLAREEDLEDAKSAFKSISSIHVYSIQPTVLQDLNSLIDVAREIATTYAQDDPLEVGKQWGMIQNPHVRRRTGARPPPPAAAAAAAPKPKPGSGSAVPAKRPLQSESSTKAETKTEEAKSQSAQLSDSQSSTKSTTKTAPAKKGDLFSSFAKAKAPKKKPETPSQPAEQKDVVLGDASEEEQEELFPDSGTKSATIRETKKEREDKLRAMMDDDDDDADDEEMPDADDEPVREPTPIEQPPPPKPTQLKEEVTVQGGRRRGKRQVMKKVQMKDEEGYLVTREEPTWESFSEDEPVPKKKPAINVPKAKAGAKAGQGNIMSFFGKK
ncbi:hypothetical protein N7468_003857 [Penicillium chermesinum]|uniref:DNA polymerase delta subunit 3 n=1 Tax=Penicillium chermesinum TaxID=63820 RepID=A0A9W9P7B6_9EURO|nr:uncharacterized protein N7468_003857 [Penicillium chermesinum]KAJ5239238.1 hypothetical protein N7468_003857 [Penicillium chermesinum]